MRGTLDLELVARLPIPGKPLAGFGAVTVEGHTYINTDLTKRIPLKEDVIREVVKEVRKKLHDRKKLLGSRPTARLRGETVILVDDGINTGYTMMAAVKSVREQSPRKVL